MKSTKDGCLAIKMQFCIKENKTVTIKQRRWLLMRIVKQAAIILLGTAVFIGICFGYYLLFKYLRNINPNINIGFH